LPSDARPWLTSAKDPRPLWSARRWCRRLHTSRRIRGTWRKRKHPCSGRRCKTRPARPRAFPETKPGLIRGQRLTRGNPAAAAGPCRFGQPGARRPKATRSCRRQLSHKVRPMDSSPPRPPSPEEAVKAIPGWLKCAVEARLAREFAAAPAHRDFIRAVGRREVDRRQERGRGCTPRLDEHDIRAGGDRVGPTRRRA